MACEQLTDEQVAEKLQVTPRWVADHARDSNDPLPHFKAGRVRRYAWDCPDSQLGRLLKEWWERRIVGRKNGRT